VSKVTGDEKNGTEQEASLPPTMAVLEQNDSKPLHEMKLKSPIIGAPIYVLIHRVGESL